MKSSNAAGVRPRLGALSLEISEVLRGTAARRRLAAPSVLVASALAVSFVAPSGAQEATPAPSQQLDEITRDWFAHCAARLRVEQPDRDDQQRRLRDSHGLERRVVSEPDAAVQPGGITRDDRRRRADHACQFRRHCVDLAARLRPEPQPRARRRQARRADQPLDGDGRQRYSIGAHRSRRDDHGRRVGRVRRRRRRRCDELHSQRRLRRLRRRLPDRNVDGG